MKNFLFALKGLLEVPAEEKRRDKRFILGLAGIVLLFALIRLLYIGIPSLLWTDWKEIDYIAISRNFLTNGFRIWEPTITWPAEPPRVTAMEFPLVPFLSSVLYKLFGYNVFTVRFVSWASFLLIIWFTGLLANRILGAKAGLIAGFFAGFIPLNSRFGNMQFSEPLLFASSLIALYYFFRYTEENRIRYLWISMGFLTLALLLKPTELYIAIPMGWLYFRKHLFHLKAWFKLAGMFAAAFVLPVIWYTYVYYLTQKSIDVFGVFGGHNKFQTLTMLSQKGWYAAMARSIYELTGGAGGFLVFLIGTLASLFLFLRKMHFPLIWLFSVGVFFVIVAEGNFDTPYRQLAIMSVGAIMMALGTQIIGKGIASAFLLKESQFIQSALLLVLTVLIVFPGFWKFFGRDDAPVHPVEWEVAKHVRSITQDNDYIITAGTYTIHKGGNDLSPVIYYYSGKQGWTLQHNSWNLEKVEELRKKGGKVFAATYILREPELGQFVEQLKEKYPLKYYSEDRQSVVLDLHQPIR